MEFQYKFCWLHYIFIYFLFWLHSWLISALKGSTSWVLTVAPSPGEGGSSIWASTGGLPPSTGWAYGCTRAGSRKTTVDSRLGTSIRVYSKETEVLTISVTTRVTAVLAAFFLAEAYISLHLAHNSSPSIKPYTPLSTSCCKVGSLSSRVWISPSNALPLTSTVIIESSSWSWLSSAYS